MSARQETGLRIGQTVRFVSKKGYTRAGGELAVIDAYFPDAADAGTDYWRVNLPADTESPEGRSYCVTADELHAVQP